MESIWWGYFSIFSICQMHLNHKMKFPLHSWNCFVVLWYDRTSGTSSTDKSRMDLFTQKGRAISFFLQPKLHLSSIWKEPHIEQATAKAKHSYVLQNCHRQHTGDGRTKVTMDGVLCGQPFQKQVSRVVSSLNVVAKNGAQQDASALKQI